MIEEKIINSEAEFYSFIDKNRWAAVYFSRESCNVCKTLKLKLIKFLSENFDKINFAYVDVELNRELAAQKNLFGVPIILFFSDGKEILRKNRFLSFEELSRELQRPYSIYFDINR